MSDSAKPEATETVDDNATSEASTSAKGVPVDNGIEKPENSDAELKSKDSNAVTPTTSEGDDTNIVDDVAAELAKPGTDSSVDTNTNHSDEKISKKGEAASPVSKDADVDHNEAHTRNDNQNMKDKTAASVSDQATPKAGNLRLLNVCNVRFIHEFACRLRQ